MNLFGTVGETVTVTPQSGFNDDGDPIASGQPVTLEAILVTPGNTSSRVNDQGELDSVEFTVYLPFGSPISDDDLIVVREKPCWARVQEWRDPWPGAVSLDCLVVLCKAVTGGG